MDECERREKRGNGVGDGKSKAAGKSARATQTLIRNRTAVL
jgi:hypothetical protein